MNILPEFIHTEREQYTGRDNNIFAISLGQAQRYYYFLLIILDRYQKASKKYVSAQNRSLKLTPTQTSEPVPVTDRQMRLMEELYRLTTLVHLEIESFYLFAKIFLDNVARFLYVYFGQVQRVRLKSHNDLAKHHKKYCEVKALVFPQGLSENIILLKERICDYRDKELSHELSLRTIKATSWGESGDTRIMVGRLYPSEFGRVAGSEELPKLMDAIDAYIRQVVTLIESNRDKPRLRLKRT